MRRRIGPLPLWILALGGLLAVTIVGVAAANTLSGGPTPGAVTYDVGDPGVGEVAPDFTLPSATGGTYQLSAQRGKTVLLYFHEGLMCAPCWQQVVDVQADLEQFTALGVDEVVAISIDPLASQAQHAEQVGVRLPALADEDTSVSQRYDALSYGMMGGTMPGHTFVLVGPDGVIRWRADYGGPPNYTMYVPNPTLLAELREVQGG
jgi:peroxiredoxin Q/BCP